MKKLTSLTLVLLLFPLVGHAQTVQAFLVNFTKFLSNVIIPFLLGLAFLFFAINAIRFFVLGSTSEEGREKAKALAIYGVLAFVLILVFWGIINLLVSSLGLGGCSAPQSDYFLLHFVGPIPPNCP